MTQEEKDLLLKDLSSRLPYGVILNCCNLVGEKLYTIDSNGLVNNDYDLEEVKPYLFPFSSMTEEQLYNNPIGFSQMLTIKADRDWENITINRRSYYKLVDWFNKYHFDYRGLIPMGLAKDATGLNIY
mgnify:CR=1 FL=1